MRRGALLAILVVGFLFLFTVIAQADTFTVNSTNDPGDGVCDATECTLREAIKAANANPGKDTIAFNIPGAGPHTIRPRMELPTITDPVIIDGYTQPGASPNTNPIELGSNAVLKIELDGSLGGSINGLVIVAGDSTVRGLVINRFPRVAQCCPGGIGIILMTNGNNVIEGNFIGTDIAGTVRLPNDQGGILVWSDNNKIGGISAPSRNVLAGNGSYGVFIDGKGNVVQGNYIGTNAMGTASLTQRWGVLIGYSSSNNVIGGTTPEARNIISGNEIGIEFSSGVSGERFGNIIQGNYIGTNAAGTGALGNTSHGVDLEVYSSLINKVGGTTSGAGNIIAFNGGAGIRGDGIISSNSIFSNTGLGIDLAFDNGVTPNDPGNADKFSNFPELTAATSSGGSTTIQGTLNSTANTTFRIEFFANTECDPSGYGEGERFIGFTDVTTDGNGDASFNITLPTSVPAGQFITSTATDPDRNTSEFSACRVVSEEVGADLAITKTDSPDPVILGDPLDPIQVLYYHITVTNNGPATATNVIMVDTLPESLDNPSADPSQGHCDRYELTITCQLGSLNPNATATIRIVAGVFREGRYINRAIVTANERDPDLSNNTTQAETTAYRPARNYGFGPHLYRILGVDPNNNNKPIMEEISLSDAPYTGTKIPLILVHGIAVRGDAISCGDENGCEDLKTRINEHFGNFIAFFFQQPDLMNKFDLFALRYNTNNQVYKGGRSILKGVDATGREISIADDNGALLARFIRLFFPYKQVVLLGYSMGGLVSLSAMGEHQDLLLLGREQVLRLITFDTLFSGTPLVGYANFVFTVVGIPLPGCNLPFLWGILAVPDYPGLNDLAWRDAKRYGTYRYPGYVPLQRLIQSVSSDQYRRKVIAYSGFFNPPANRPLGNAYRNGAACIESLGFSPSDGTVPAQSSRGDGLPLLKRTDFTDYDHSEIVQGKGDGELFSILKSDLLAIEAPACSINARSIPTSVTYTPTKTQASIRIIVTNNNSSPQIITSITPQADEPFTIVSISPRLPLSIPSRRDRVFTVQTRRAAGLGTVTATAPYFDITLGCGTVISATEPRLLVPLSLERVQAELRAGQVWVEAQGEGIASVHLQLFDLSGRKLLDQSSVSNVLTLPAVTHSGQPLATGVYLYVVRVRGFDGQEYVSAVR